MAFNWQDLREDANRRGAFMRWDVEVTAYRDWRMSVEGIFTDNAGNTVDWTAIDPTGVDAKVYDPRTRASLLTLAFKGTAAGVLAFEASRTDSLNIADPAVHPDGRRLRWMCRIVDTTGNWVQLVDPRSEFHILPYVVD